MTPDDALLARYLAHECTPAEAAAVRQWIAADLDRVRAVERLRATFDAAAPPHQRPDVDAMWAQVRAHHPTSLPPARRRPFPVTLVAAAAVLVVAVLVDRAISRRSTTHGAVREIATSTGQRATIDLADGSRVILGPRSRISTPEHFGEGPRDVTLEGEAYFEVRHDSTHPFRVHTAGGIAEDIGTRFVVRAYAGEPALRVVVAEGRVSVTRSGGAPVALGAGQLASFDAAGTASVRPVDTAAYVAFSDGRLVFDGTPLDEVVSELGRWYDLDVRLAAPEFAGRHISASFTGLAEDDVLGAVAAAAGLRYTRQGRTVTFSRARGIP
ncbi:MAG TPA: FecR domain-containing protein [Gemmatimonadaceae bacterium]|jgi:transmembrane sensor|nr:FecR domain-containing protein [Gemmatimonadaceae bacterium]